MDNHISNELSAYLDGRADGDAARRIAAHLSACAFCRREAEDFRAMKGGLAGLERNAAPPALVRSLAHAFLDAPKPAEGWWRGVFAAMSWRPVSAFAAAAVMAVGLFFLRVGTRDDGMDIQPLIAAHMRYQAENLVPTADLAHSNLSAQLVSYNAQED